MKHIVMAFGFVALVACGEKKEDKPSDKIDIKEIKDEAGVDFAKQNLAEIDTKLASADPGAASSICAVIKPDMPAIKKADAKLAAQVEKQCGHDLAVRSLTVFVERVEAETANGGRTLQCSSLDIYLKTVVAAKAENEPEVVALKERFAKACPPRK
jgi:hypothetical protein